MKKNNYDVFNIIRSVLTYISYLLCLSHYPHLICGRALSLSPCFSADQDIQVYPDQHPPDPGFTQQGQAPAGPPPAPLQRLTGTIRCFSVRVDFATLHSLNTATVLKVQLLYTFEVIWYFIFPL